MLRLTNLVLVVIIFVSFSFGQYVKYDNYKLYLVKPQNRKQHHIVNKLEAPQKGVIFFSEIRRINRPISILVAPNKKRKFIRTLKSRNIPYRLLEKNFQKVLNKERVFLKQRRDGVYDWTGYHSLNETYAWLKSLKMEFPKIIKFLVGGSSYEGREILGVKVSFKSGNKGVFLESGSHAREWIAPATLTYILDQILRSDNAAIRKTVEKFDWYIFPHANPDGYEYSQTAERFWRKTRSPQGDDCFGVDPNRNWDAHWNTVEESVKPCSEAFPGPAAFSEIETRSLSDYMRSLKNKIHTYISYHAFSQLLLYPYGYTSKLTPNYQDLQRIGEVAVRALEKRFGTKYEVGNVYDTIYPASGSSLEWAYDVLGVKLAYTYELRPTGESPTGFILPPDQIIPIGQETLDSLLALLNEAEKLNYYQ